MLTIVDNYTRECLAIEVDGSLRGEYVVAALTRLAHHRPLPRYIKADNGSEFISKALDKWAYENGVEIDFSRPGKPTDNAKNESFNGRFREEYLNAHWFLSLEDARRKIEVWREYYNEACPHSVLQWMIPAEFARQCTDRADSARPAPKSRNFPTKTGTEIGLASHCCRYWIATGPNMGRTVGGEQSATAGVLPKGSCER
ncbi:transposase [Burkholderia aenigmatica]|uniref:Transposase n=1 Tax=Burkholderia aenigmatica TaxID=2015348 RepID=A0A6P2I5D2_9BURK|nr:transposase [Burkholderia aenigmatica]